MQPLKRHAVVDFALREFGELPKAAERLSQQLAVTDQIGFQHSPFQSTLPRSGGADSKTVLSRSTLAGKSWCWLENAGGLSRYCFLSLLRSSPPDYDFRAFADYMPTYLAQQAFIPAMWCCPIEVNFLQSF